MQEELGLSNESGYFHLTDWDVIEVSGPDAGDFLHRLSSADIKRLPTDQATLGAFLTGKGTLIGFGFIYRTQTAYWIVAGPHQAERLCSHLEQFHFQEQLVIQKKSDKEISVVVSYHSELKFGTPTWKDFFHPQLNWALLSPDFVPLDILPIQKFHELRISAGMPYFGWEVFEGDLVLEAGLEKAVARNKGCYPGQEVVERVFTYGQVNWKLLRVELNLRKPIQTGSCDLKLSLNGKEVGVLRSLAQDAKSAKAGWGLARLRKEAWNGDQEIEGVPGLFLKVKKDN